jgi:hypothetical protein
MTHNAATRTVCLIMCVMCAANHRVDGATNETNLLRYDNVRAISGTLSGDGLVAALGFARTPRRV